MHYVYIIRSVSRPDQRYIGMADDVSSRLVKHNNGGSPHTAKFKPWRLEVVIGLESKEKAAAFESYLKSGSGFAFTKKHF